MPADVAVTQRSGTTDHAATGAQRKWLVAQDMLELGPELAGHGVEDDGVARTVHVEHNLRAVEHRVIAFYPHVFVVLVFGN